MQAFGAAAAEAGPLNDVTRRPHLAILHTHAIPAELFTEFSRIVSSESLGLALEAREEDGPFAALEWLVPTAVIIYVSKSYFDSFLKEMGKDHYGLLKAGLKTLHGKLVGPNVPKAVVVSTQGKVSDERVYSLRYSILAEANEQRRFKLLIQSDVSSDQYDQILESFLAFFDAYHNGNVDPEMVKRLKDTRVVSSTILLAFDFETMSLEPVDPVSAGRRYEA